MRCVAFFFFLWGCAAMFSPSQVTTCQPVMPVPQGNVEQLPKPLLTHLVCVNVTVLENLVDTHVSILLLR